MALCLPTLGLSDFNFLTFTSFILFIVHTLAFVAQRSKIKILLSNYISIGNKKSIDLLIKQHNNEGHRY